MNFWYAFVLVDSVEGLEAVTTVKLAVVEPDKVVHRPALELLLWAMDINMVAMVDPMVGSPTSRICSNRAMIGGAARQQS